MLYLSNKPSSTSTNIILIKNRLPLEGAFPLEHYDLMSVLMICLGAPDEKDPNDSGMLKTLIPKRTVGLMCNLSEGVRRKAEAVTTAKVRQQEREEGIKSSIEIISELGVSKTVAVEKIQQKYALPVQQAQQYVNQYYPN